MVQSEQQIFWILFWTSGDVCSGFQSHGESFLTCMILGFTSGVTPTDCIEVSMLAKPFLSLYLQTMCSQALLGAQTHNQHSALDHLTTLAWLAFVPFGLLRINKPLRLLRLLGLLDYIDYLYLLDSLDPLDSLVIKKYDWLPLTPFKSSI